MANTKSLHKFNIAMLIVVLSHYTKQDSMLLDHFCTFRKTHLQLLFVEHEDILSTGLVIYRSGNGAVEGRVRGITPTKRKRKESASIHFYKKESKTWK